MDKVVSYLRYGSALSTNRTRPAIKTPVTAAAATWRPRARPIAPMTVGPDGPHARPQARPTPPAARNHGPAAATWARLTTGRKHRDRPTSASASETVRTKPVRA